MDEAPDLHRSIGVNVRARRVALGLTLEALEDGCGVGAAFIGQIERGVKRGSLFTLVRLASGLGMALDDLIQDGRPAARLDEGSRLAALLRRHEAHEREFLYAALQDLSRRLKSMKGRRSR